MPPGIWAGSPVLICKNSPIEGILPCAYKNFSLCANLNPDMPLATRCHGPTGRILISRQTAHAYIDYVPATPIKNPYASSNI